MLGDQAPATMFPSLPRDLLIPEKVVKFEMRDFTVRRNTTRTRAKTRKQLREGARVIARPKRPGLVTQHILLVHL